MTKPAVPRQRPAGAGPNEPVLGAGARLLGLAFALAGAAGCGGGQRFAELGDLPTEAGGVVRGCRVGYRTFGALDDRRSNAVLLLPWFGGTSEDLAGHVGPGKFLDTGRFHVIAVDALGNGVSTSPSNSAAQPGDAFPPISIVDMVEAQHALVTRVLGIERLRGVVGVSMGGMQALAWATRHPDVAGDVVVVAGSPRSTARDRAYWQAEVERMRVPAWRRALGAAARLDRSGLAWHLRFDPRDHALQARAIAELDLTVPHGGSLEATARAVRGRLLVAVPERDDVVDPEPARAFARLAGAELLSLDGRCGHDAPTCEAEVLGSAVTRFLAVRP